jgi:hypothetical protein
LQTDRKIHGVPQDCNLNIYQEWDEKYPSLSHQTTDDFIQRSDLQLSITDSQAVLLGEDITRRFNISQTTVIGIQRFLLKWGVGQSVSHINGPTYNDVIVYPTSWDSWSGE